MESFALSLPQKGSEGATGAGKREAHETGVIELDGLSASATACEVARFNVLDLSQRMMKKSTMKTRYTPDMEIAAAVGENSSCPRQGLATGESSAMNDRCGRTRLTGNKSLVKEMNECSADDNASTAAKVRQ